VHETNLEFLKIIARKKIVLIFLALCRNYVVRNYVRLKKHNNETNLTESLFSNKPNIIIFCQFCFEPSVIFTELFFSEVECIFCPTIFLFLG
jgi:hypothetical protein